LNSIEYMLWYSGLAVGTAGEALLQGDGATWSAFSGNTAVGGLYFELY
jgi:hypothetical protein